MKNIKLKVGVIGLGVGYYHLKCFMQNKFCKVVSVCDFDKKKIDKIKKKFPKLKTTLNHKDIINNKEIDLVCIASYDNYHCSQILESVKNKKHVFVEKPICTNYKEYIKIKNIFKKHPKSKISSNFILRTSPQFIQLNNLVKMK